MRRRVDLAATAALPLVARAADFSASNNVAVYWGQNSFGQSSGDLAQQGLATYCASTNIDIIPLAFLLQITTGTGGQPVINFANSGNACTLFPGTSLLNCPEIGEDIKTCQQQYGKTILLSIGGATYTEGGFTSEQAAVDAAELVWDTFGVSGAAVVPDPSVSTTTVTSTTDTQSVTPTLTTSTSVLTATLATDTSSLTASQETMTTTSGPTSTDATSTSTTELTPETLTSTATDQLTTTDTTQLTTSTDIPDPTTFEATFIGDDTNNLETPCPTGGGRWNGGGSPGFNRGGGGARFGPGRPGPGPVVRRQSTTTLRPFGDAIIDGFDLDLESVTTNFAPFTNRLRALMDAASAQASNRKFYITAAPQCVYPDAALNSLLTTNQVRFDALFVQFYNNPCGVDTFVSGANDQGSFNLKVWDEWAKTWSANKDVKIYLGVPAGQTAAGRGYLPLEGLRPVIEFAKGFGSFGGVMMWDASQAFANTGFLEGVKSALNGAAGKMKRGFVERMWFA